MVIKLHIQKDNEYYIVSTKKDIITSVYATGKDVKVDPLTIGESASHLFENTSINRNQRYNLMVRRIDLKCRMKT